MQQTYRTTSMPKCGLNKVAKQLYWNHTLVWRFFWHFAAYFQNTFLKNTSRRLILNHTSFTYLTKLEKKLFSYTSTLLLVKFIVIQHTYSNVWIVDKNMFYSCRICVSRTLNILSFSVSCIILDGYTKDY